MQNCVIIKFRELYPRDLFLFNFQSMWEDSKTGVKWVKVTKCYFPDDLPGNIGHPCISEVNEVTLFIFICKSSFKSGASLSS